MNQFYTLSDKTHQAPFTVLLTFRNLQGWKYYPCFIDKKFGLSSQSKQFV